MQQYTIYLYLQTALHVSDGISTHHQELILLYLQYLALLRPLLLPVVNVAVWEWQVAVKASVIPDTVGKVIWAPDDGRKYHPKHVEQFADINKLCVFAFCWIIIDTYYAMHGPLKKKHIYIGGCPAGHYAFILISRKNKSWNSKIWLLHTVGRCKKWVLPSAYKRRKKLFFIETGTRVKHLTEVLDVKMQNRLSGTNDPPRSTPWPQSKIRKSLTTATAKSWTRIYLNVLCCRCAAVSPSSEQITLVPLRRRKLSPQNVLLI